MWDDEVTTTGIDQRRQLEKPFKPNNCDWVAPVACSGRTPLRVLTNERAPLQASTVPALHHSCSNSPQRHHHSEQGSSTDRIRSLSTSPVRRHSKVSAVERPKSALVPDPGLRSHASGAEVGDSDAASASSASAESVAGMEAETSLPASRETQKRQALPKLESQSHSDHQSVPLLQSAFGNSEAQQQQHQQQHQHQNSAAGAATAEARILELEARLTRQQEDFRRVLAEEVDIQVALQTCVFTSYLSTPYDSSSMHVNHSLSSVLFCSTALAPHSYNQGCPLHQIRHQTIGSAPYVAVLQRAGLRWRMRTKR